MLAQLSRNMQPAEPADAIAWQHVSALGIMIMNGCSMKSVEALPGLHKARQQLEKQREILTDASASRGILSFSDLQSLCSLRTSLVRVDHGGLARPLRQPVVPLRRQMKTDVAKHSTTEPTTRPSTPASVPRNIAQLVIHFT